MSIFDISKKLLSDKLENYEFSTIGQFFNINIQNANGAEKDCIIAYKAYEKLKDNLPKMEL